jgi:hypothetical protein
MEGVFPEEKGCVTKPDFFSGQRKTGINFGAKLQN